MIEGVLFALGATFCFAFGNILEKRGVDNLSKFTARQPLVAILALAKSRWWLAGAALSAAGLLAQIVALAHLSISIVQSIGVAGIVLLVVISHLHLHETLDRVERAGLVVAVAGFAFVSLSLTRTADAPGVRVPDLGAIVTAVATIGVAGSVFLLRRLLPSEAGVTFGVGAGLFYGLAGIGAKGISAITAHRGIVRALEPLATSGFPYIFVGSWVIGLALFQMGIQRSRVAITGPLSTMVGSVFTVAVGTPLFGEHLPSSPLLLFFRVAGFASLAVGSAAVARGGPTVAIGDVVLGEAVVASFRPKDGQEVIAEQ
jgi:drug/metabolite transporter (DMT)-like permease